MSSPTKAKIPTPTRVKSALSKLSQQSLEINAASDRLTVLVAQVEQHLRKLNLGVTAWIDVTAWTDENNEYEVERLGYSKVAGKWCIALQEAHGNHANPERENSVSTIFVEASREARMRSVRFLTHLLEALARLAEQTAVQLKEEVEATEELVSVLTVIREDGKSD